LQRRELEVKEIVTRDLVRKKTKGLGLAEEVERILTLAEVLELQPLERTPSSVPFRLTVGANSKTIFRVDPDHEGSGEVAVLFPFWTWEVPFNRVLETLRRELLEDLEESRIDKGSAEEDIRLALTKSNTNRIIAAICTIYSEVRRDLRYQTQ